MSAKFRRRAGKPPTKPDRLGRYYTPPKLAAAVVRELPIQAGQVVWDPHCGAGAWLTAVQQYHPAAHVTGLDVDPGAPFLSSRLRPGDLAGVHDFMYDPPAVFGRPDWIIGNPPYRSTPSQDGAEPDAPLDAAAVSDACMHTLRALQMVSVGLAFLLRLGFLASRAREALFRKYPPYSVTVLVERPSFTGRGSDSADYCVVTWDKSKNVQPGQTNMNWLSWR